MTAEQFWRLTPAELWWWHEARTPVRMYGGMTEDEVRQIYDEAYGPGASL